MTPYVLAVDVGTTYTAAAIARSGHVTPLALGRDRPTMASVVFLDDDGDLIVGDDADRRAVQEPGRAARETKRRLGDPVPIVLGDRTLAAHEVLARLLAHVVARATAEEGAPPALVVVTHPANYTGVKTALVRDAAGLAGIAPSTLRLLDEASAALQWTTRDAPSRPGDLVAVYDLGGGTVDVALMRRTTTGFALAGTPDGLERFGGIDIDRAVLAHVDAALGGRVARLDGHSPDGRRARAELRAACTRAKEALSADGATAIPVVLDGVVTSVPLTRVELESMVAPRLDDTVEALRRTVASAGAQLSELHEIVLVGGSSALPVVERRIAEATGCPVRRDDEPKLAVASGAARAGAAELALDRAVPPAVAPWRSPVDPARVVVSGRPRRRSARLAVAAAAVAVGAAVAGAGVGAIGWRDDDGAVVPAAPGATRPAAGRGPVIESVPVEVASVDALAVAADGIVVGVSDVGIVRVVGGRARTVGTVTGPIGGVAVTPDGAVLVTTTRGVLQLDDGRWRVLVEADALGLGPTPGPVTTDRVGNVYVADPANRRVLRLGADGSGSLVAGDGTIPSPGTTPGEGDRGERAAIGAVVGLRVDGRGNLLLADRDAGTVRAVSPDGIVTTIAGAGSVVPALVAPAATAATAATATSAAVRGRDLRLTALAGLTVDDTGTVWVSDATSGTVLRLTLDGSATVVLGPSTASSTASSTSGPSETSRGPSTVGALVRPGVLAAGRAPGELFVADGRIVRRVVGLG